MINSRPETEAEMHGLTRRSSTWMKEGHTIDISIVQIGIANRGKHGASMDTGRQVLYAVFTT